MTDKLRSYSYNKFEYLIFAPMLRGAVTRKCDWEVYTSENCYSKTNWIVMLRSFFIYKAGKPLSLSLCEIQLPWQGAKVRECSKNGGEAMPSDDLNFYNLTIIYQSSLFIYKKKYIKFLQGCRGKLLKKFPLHFL